MFRWTRNNSLAAYPTLYVAIKASRNAQRDQILYKVLFLQEQGRTEEAALKAHFGPGDDGEPVVTIMQPDED